MSSRINLLGVWLLSKWQPACRRRDSDLGSYRELREPVVLMKRENSKKPKSFKEKSTNARNWGGAIRSSEETPVMGME